IPATMRDVDTVADVIARLPTSAQEVIESIRALDLVAEGKRHAKYDTLTSLREDRDNATRELGLFDRDPRNDSEARQKVRATMVARLDAIKEKMRKTQETTIESGFSVNRIEDWAEKAGPFAQFEAVEIEPCDADDPMAELARIRQQRVDLIDERD